MSKLSLRLGTLLLAGFFVLSVVTPSFAQIDTTQTESETGEAESSGRSDDAKARRDERKAERQERVEERVTQAELTRASARCTGAQNALEAAVQRVDGVKTRRTEQYGKVSEKLNSLTNRIRAAEVDTSVLEGQIETFDTLVQEFYAELDIYYTALSDAAEMDCEADAEAFMLAVKDARESIPTLKDLAKQIRSQVRDTIVTTLRDIADSLSSRTEDADETESEDETETETENESDSETETENETENESTEQ